MYTTVSTGRLAVCPQQSLIQCTTTSGNLAARFPAPRLQRLASRPSIVVYAAASPNESAPQTPWQPNSSLINHAVEWAVRVVHDAVVLVQRLWHLVQRIRIASAAIQQQSDRAKLASEASKPSPITPVQQIIPLAQTLAAQTSTQLQQTLNDCSGTLDAKWKVLEDSTSSAMNNLFNATKSYIDDDADTLPDSRASVLAQEDQLRAQVFAQVMAELSRKNGNTPGFQGA